MERLSGPRAAGIGQFVNDQSEGDDGLVLGAQGWLHDQDLCFAQQMGPCIQGMALQEAVMGGGLHAALLCGCDRQRGQQRREELHQLCGLSKAGSAGILRMGVECRAMRGYIDISHGDLRSIIVVRLRDGAVTLSRSRLWMNSKVRSYDNHPKLYCKSRLKEKRNLFQFVSLGPLIQPCFARVAQLFLYSFGDM